MLLQVGQLPLQLGNQGILVKACCLPVLHVAQEELRLCSLHSETYYYFGGELGKSQHRMKRLHILFASAALLAALGTCYTRYSLASMQRTKTPGPYYEGSAAKDQQR